MTELVNFTFYIMKISNFRHKLAFKQVVRFKSPSVYFAAPKELYKFSLVTMLTLDGFGRPSETISVTP